MRDKFLRPRSKYKNRNEMDRHLRHKQSRVKSDFKALHYVKVISANSCRIDGQAADSLIMQGGIGLRLKKVV